MAKTLQIKLSLDNSDARTSSQQAVADMKQIEAGAGRAGTAVESAGKKGGAALASGARQGGQAFEAAAKKIAAAGEVAESATKKFGGASKDSAFAVTNLARATQDFAFGGLPAISNNIEQLIPSLATIGKVGFAAFAGPAGIAAGLTLVATLWPQIQSGASMLFDLFRKGEIDTSAFTDAVVRLNERIEELKAKNPVRISVEGQELQRLEADLERIKKLRSEIDAFLGTKSRAEVESTRRLQAGLAERPGGGQAAVVEAIARQQEISGKPIGNAEQRKAMEQLAAQIAEQKKVLASDQRYEARVFENTGKRSTRLSDQTRDTLKELRDKLEAARADARKFTQEQINSVFAQATRGEIEEDPLKQKGIAHYQEQAAQLAREAGLGDVADLFGREGIGANARRLRQEEQARAEEQKQREAMQRARDLDALDRLRKKRPSELTHADRLQIQDLGAEYPDYAPKGRQPAGLPVAPAAPVVPAAGGGGGASDSGGIGQVADLLRELIGIARQQAAGRRPGLPMRRPGLPPNDVLMM